jgi:uncharacterized membrane protein
MAALAHGSSVVGFAMFAPLILWLVYRNRPDGQFVAFHALQATVFHFAAFAFIMVTAFCTFGLSTVLLLPWFALDVWMAVRAWQGEWAGYPGMADLGR